MRKESLFTTNRATKVYVSTVIVAGTATFVLSVLTNPDFWLIDWFALFLFILLNLFAEGTYAILPNGGRMTASFSIILSALVIFNAPVAVLIAGMGNIFSTVIVQKRHWSIAIFNFAQYSIAYCAAAGLMYVVFLWTSSTFPDINPTLQLFLGAGAGTGIYLLCSICLVNGFLNIRRSGSFRKSLKRLMVWKDDQWEFWQAMALYPIAVLIAHFYQILDRNIFSVLALIIPTILVIKLKAQQLQIECYKERLEKLYEITKELGESGLRRVEDSLKEKEIWYTIFRNIGRIIDNSRCSIYQVESLGGEPRITQEATDLVYAEPENKYYLEEEGPLQSIVLTSKGILLPQFTAPNPHYAGWRDYNSVLAEPIMVNDIPDRIIVLFDVHSQAFQREHQQLLRLLVKQIEVALKNIQLRQEIQEQAITDGLMGIFNHRYLKVKMEEELSRAKRYSKPMSLIICDVDYFKKFNDTHGHLLGDHVLKSMADILLESVREIDIVARYGGEELAIILPETSLGAACEVAERVRRNVARFPFIGKDNQTVSLSVSVGITCTDTDPDLQVSELIVRADTALYKAKNQGRNQICRAIVDQGKLIIETFSRGDQPQQPDKKPLALLPTLDRESLVLWTECLANGEKQILESLTSELHEQHKQLFDTQDNLEYLQGITRIALQLLQQYLQDNSQEFWHQPSPFGPAGQSILQFAQSQARDQIQQREKLLRFEDGLTLLHKSTAEYVQSASLQDQSKDTVVHLIHKFFRALNLIAIDTCWYTYDSEKQFIETLYQASHRSNGLLRSDALHQTLTRFIAQSLNVDYAFAATLSADNHSLVIKAIYGLERMEQMEAFKDVRLNINESRLGHVLEHRELLQVHSISAFFVNEPLVEYLLDATSALFVPLCHQDRKLGLFAALTKDPHTFTPEQIKLARALTQEMAIGLDRSVRQDEQSATFTEMLKAIIDHLEARKAHTRNHSERVSFLAGRLGQHLNLSAKEQGRLKMAAYLHDLGKIVVPEEILAKETGPSEYDRHLIRQHVLAGARLLESVPYLKPLAPAIRHHHEHWDGSGYPEGLKGKSIPLFSRIIGLIDAYENTLRQSPDLPPPKILHSLQSTGHFDPELCKLLERVIGYDRILS